MPTFKNLKQLQKYADKQVQKAITSPILSSVFAQAMQESVDTEVYAYYQAQEYENRGDDGGLSDMNNMQFTSTLKIGNTYISEFENLTVGVDSMEGKYISELIENGGTEGWANPNGIWTDPRPFAQATALRLNHSDYNGYIKVVLETEINS